MILENRSVRRQMTPEEVLCVLISRQKACQEDVPAEKRTVEFHFDMPLDEYETIMLDAPGILPLDTDAAWPADDMWDGMERLFDVSIPGATWKFVITPWAERTLRDLCEVVAKYAYVDASRPVTLFGRTCEAAGTFVVVRSAMARAGIDVSDLRPSTRLDAVLKPRYHLAFDREMTKVAPGRVSPARWEFHIVCQTFANIAGIGGVMSVIGGILILLILPLFLLPEDGSLPVQIIVGSLAVISLVGASLGLMLLTLGLVGLLATCWLPPREIAVGGLETMRDLCCAVAKKT